MLQDHHVQLAIGAVFLFGGVAWAFLCWRPTLKRVGLFWAPHYAIELRRLVYRSRRRAALLLSEGVMVICASSFIGRTTGLAPGLPAVMAMTWFGAAFYVWARFTAPPAVLFLSASDAGALQRHSHLAQSLRPWRVVSLLRATPESEQFYFEQARWDNFRTRSDDDWKQTVRTLAGAAAAVVIDCRASSEPVAYELRYVFEQITVFRKAVFVVDPARADETEVHLKALAEAASRPFLIPYIRARMSTESDQLAAVGDAIAAADRAA